MNIKEIIATTICLTAAPQQFLAAMALWAVWQDINRPTPEVVKPVEKFKLENSYDR